MTSTNNGALAHSSQDKVDIRQEYQRLTNAQKIAFISSLTPAAYTAFRYDTDNILRDGQIIKDGEWRYYILQCGRAWGKSMAGAHWLADKVYRGHNGLAVVAPTHSDIVDYIKLALEEEFPKDKQPRYVGGDKAHFVCYNNIIIKAYSSDKEIRGANLKYVWCDEFCAWNERNEEKATKNLDILDFAVRKGKSQILITTTPRPWKIMSEWNHRFNSGDKRYYMVFGETDENTALTLSAKTALYSKYANTRLGEQELYGHLLTDNPNAYWTRMGLEECRSPVPAQVIKKQRPLENDILMGRVERPEQDTNPIKLLRIIIGLDPAVSIGGDETGIIVAALFSNNHAYVLEDASGHYAPDIWARKVSDLYIKYGAAAVVVEKNQGGNTLEFILRSVNKHMNVINIHTKQGKTTRAEHISALYAQGKVHHTESGIVFKKLEDQMCSFDVNYSESPDRLDALNFALSELMWQSQGPPGLGDIRNLIRMR